MEISKETWSKVEFVTANLNDANMIEKAVEGASFVVHSASPVCIETPKDENDIIGPAVNGCLFVL